MIWIFFWGGDCFSCRRRLEKEMKNVSSPVIAALSQDMMEKESRTNKSKKDIECFLVYRDHQTWLLVDDVFQQTTKSRSIESPFHVDSLSGWGLGKRREKHFSHSCYSTTWGFIHLFGPPPRRLFGRHGHDGPRFDDRPVKPTRFSPLHLQRIFNSGGKGTRWTARNNDGNTMHFSRNSVPLDTVQSTDGAGRCQWLVDPILPFQSIRKSMKYNSLYWIRLTRRDSTSV